MPAAQHSAAALKGWSEACGWTRRYVRLASDAAWNIGGHWDTPPKLDPLIQAALDTVVPERLKGALTKGDHKEIAFCRQDFLRAYAALAEEAAPVLPVARENPGRGTRASSTRESTGRATRPPAINRGDAHG